MRIEIKTESYNERRYSRPWIAVVSFDREGKLSYNFGGFVGQHGYEGMVTVEANTGDVIATGQKDYRKPKNSAPTFYRVEEDGNIVQLDGKLEAFKHYRNSHKNEKETLLKEKERLELRLQEIEEKLREL